MTERPRIPEPIPGAGPMAIEAEWRLNRIRYPEGWEVRSKTEIGSTEPTNNNERFQAGRVNRKPNAAPQAKG